MDNLLPPVADPANDLARGLFGYRIKSINRYVTQLVAAESERSRPWQEDMQRIKMDLALTQERKKNLDDRAAYLRLECERLRLQLEREKMTARYAEEGVRQEIRRLETDHNQRVQVIQADRSRSDREIQHAEELLWNLSESLSRVLQESQTIANQQLSPESPESVWKAFIQLVLGKSHDETTPEFLGAGHLLRYALPDDRVQMMTRQGQALGIATAVIISRVPSTIVAYVVPPLGAILAEDVQVIRYRNLMVRQHYQVVSESMLFEALPSRSRSGDTVKALPSTMALSISPAVDPSTKVDVTPEWDETAAEGDGPIDTEAPMAHSRIDLHQPREEISVPAASTDRNGQLTDRDPSEMLTSGATEPPEVLIPPHASPLDPDGPRSQDAVDPGDGMETVTAVPQHTNLDDLVTEREPVELSVNAASQVAQPAAPPLDPNDLTPQDTASPRDEMETVVTPSEHPDLESRLTERNSSEIPVNAASSRSEVSAQPDASPLDRDAAIPQDTASPRDGVEVASPPTDHGDLDGSASERGMVVNAASQTPHVLAEPLAGQEPEIPDHSGTLQVQGSHASYEDHPGNLTINAPKEEPASAAIHVEPKAPQRESFHSDLPEPLWSEAISAEADTESSRGLALPGINEEAPPSIRTSQPKSLDGVFDQEPLPGLNRSPVTLPPPIWTDGPGDRNPKPVAKPPAQAAPPPPSTPSPGVPAESGGLDVRTFLYGKRVGQDIVDNQRNLIAKAGETITPELVARVETAGQLPDLIVHMVF